jgi:squalene-hopene/tetraprenyl-beta-curcumene cyclase
MIQEQRRAAASPALWEPPESPAAVARAIAAARRSLLAVQRPDGHWCGELEGDTILESEYLLVLCFFGRLGSPRARKAGRYLKERQLPAGGWAIYPGGPPEVSASIKAYFALKLLGEDPRAPHMERARRVILELGGIEASNSFTKIYLAIFGQYEWSRCPAVPPEMVLAPRWFPFNPYEMSAWSRTIVVPLSIIWARRPHHPVPPAAGIGELRAAAPPSPAQQRGPLPWIVFFSLVDASLKLADGLRLRPLRQRALAQAEAWTLERAGEEDGLGAIFPPIVNALIALSSLGHGADHPAIERQLAALERLVIEEEETARVQPCFSPVWDTALATTALAASGLADETELREAARWLLAREVRQRGDWQLKLPGVEPSGWFFQYANAFYPDCDDTSQVLIALSAVRFADAGEERRRREACARGLAWLLGMQNDDGGWGAFDRGCDREALTLVPFADHNAMIDPSTVDVTGRTLEALAGFGLGAGHAAVDRAVAYVLAEQEADGAWYGRWGCNYLYGTWLALRGLRAALGAGIAGEPWCRRAVAWLTAHQNPDGGWGETPLSYEQPEARGRGPSTAAQTAWALMALAAAGELDHPAVARGRDYLLATQREDGTWQDEPWTGTGFPRVFYLRYHLYATYFPLLALATCEGDGR